MKKKTKNGYFYGLLSLIFAIAILSSPIWSILFSLPFNGSKAFDLLLGIAVLVFPVFAYIFAFVGRKYSQKGSLARKYSKFSAIVSILISWF